jgi:hypothetical protein
MKSLNISNNDIGKLVPPKGWSNQYSDGSGEWSHTDGRKQRGWPAGSKPQGVTALADGIKNMEALLELNLCSNQIHSNGLAALTKSLKQNQGLTKLDISSNAFTNKGGGEALAELLLANSVLQELDISCSTAQLEMMSQAGLGTEFAVAVASGLAANKTLLKLNMSQNRCATKIAGAALQSALAVNTVLTELDVSSSTWAESWGFNRSISDGPGFVQQLCSSSDIVAGLGTLNISDNGVDGDAAAEQFRALAMVLVCERTSRALTLTTL